MLLQLIASNLLLVMVAQWVPRQSMEEDLHSLQLTQDSQDLQFICLVAASTLETKVSQVKPKVPSTLKMPCRVQEAVQLLDLTVQSMVVEVFQEVLVWVEAQATVQLEEPWPRVL